MKLLHGLVAVALIVSQTLAIGLTQSSYLLDDPDEGYMVVHGSENHFSLDITDWRGPMLKFVQFADASRSQKTLVMQMRNDVCLVQRETEKIDIYFEYSNTIFTCAPRDMYVSFTEYGGTFMVLETHNCRVADLTPAETNILRAARELMMT